MPSARGTGGPPSLSTWVHTMCPRDLSRHHRWCSGMPQAGVSLFHMTRQHIFKTLSNPIRGSEISPFQKERSQQSSAQGTSY